MYRTRENSRRERHRTKHNVMKKDNFEDAIREYRKKAIEKFENDARNSKEFKTIPADAGLSYVIEGCDGFCPECDLVLTCETYEKIKETWRLFYS